MIARREFIAVVGGAAMWPLTARAQGERMRRLGVLVGLVEDDPETQARITAFEQGLKELGWAAGRNIRVDYRFAGSDAARMAVYAAELVGSSPDLIVGISGAVVAALKHATRTVPIVFAVVNDPVGQGFVASPSRPGGNITGFTFVDFTMVGKWLELLKEMAPGVKRAALMFNPDVAPYYDVYLREFRAVPGTLASVLAAAPVRDKAELEAVVGTLAREPGGGLIAAADPFILANRAMIITLADRHRLPVIYHLRRVVAEGGLMSYGPDAVDIFRRSASYVDRILKGEKPADLPVQEPTKFQLVINRKTAKALGMTVPPTLLARADEVIE